MDRRCPDCGVTMEPVKLQGYEGYSLQVGTDERKDGFLGSLGMTESHSISSVLCPECGLVRLYADVE